MSSSQAHKGRAVLHLCDKLGAGGASIHGVGSLLSWWFSLFEKQRYRPPLDLLDDPRQVLKQLDRFRGARVRRGPTRQLDAPACLPDPRRELPRQSRPRRAHEPETDLEERGDDERDRRAERGVMGPELRAFGYGETEVRGLSVWRQLSVRGNKLLMNAARHPWIWPMTGPARRLLKLLGLLVESRQERDSDS